MQWQFLHMLLCLEAILLQNNTKVMACSSCKWICMFSLSCAGCLWDWQAVRPVSEWTFTASRQCGEGGVGPHTDLRLTTRSSHFGQHKPGLPIVHSASLSFAAFYESGRHATPSPSCCHITARGDICHNNMAFCSIQVFHTQRGKSIEIARSKQSK